MQNVCFGIQHLPKPEQKKRAETLLERVDLIEYKNAYPHTLSGGQQQRVALVRGLAPRPKFLLLDEPLANLDHRLRTRLREEIRELLKNLGIAAILVSHQPEEALQVADRILLLRKNGQLHQIGTPDDVHDTPVDLEAARFFGPVYTFPGQLDQGCIRSIIGCLPSQYAPKDLPNGAKVQIGVRPEGLTIANSLHPGLETPHAKVTNIRHTGTGRLVEAMLNNNQTFKFHEFYTTKLSVGDNIKIAFRPPHVFVF